MRLSARQASCAASASEKPEKRARNNVVPPWVTFSVKGAALPSAPPLRWRASASIDFALPSSSMAPSWITQGVTVTAFAAGAAASRGARASPGSEAGRREAYLAPAAGKAAAGAGA